MINLSSVFQMEILTKIYQALKSMLGDLVGRTDDAAPY